MAKTKKKRKPAAQQFPWGWIVLGIAVVIVGISGMWLSNWWGKTGREVQVELAKIRSVNEPVTRAETEQWLSGLSGDAELGKRWLQPVPILRQFLGTDAARDLPFVGQEREAPPLVGDWRRQTEAEVLLGRVQAQVDSILEVAKSGGGRIPVVMSASDAETIPVDTDGLRQIVRLLQLRAYVQMRQGKWTDVANSIQAILALIQVMESTPDLNTQLTRVAFTGVVTRMLAEVLPNAQFTAEELTRMEAAMGRLRFRPGLKLALIADRAVAMEGLDQITRWPAVQANFVKHKQASASDKLFYLACSRTLISSLDTGLQDFVKGANANQQLFTDLRQQSNYAISRKYYTAIAFPASRELAEAMTAAETGVSISRALLLMASQKVQSGKWPDSLEELSKANVPLPVDPISQQPLKLIPSGNNWVIYGVGTNGADDHGNIDSQPRLDVGYLIKR